MASRKKCVVCQKPFSGRADAKTCSARCRKQLHRTRRALSNEIAKFALPLSEVVGDLKSSISSPAFETVPVRIVSSELPVQRSESKSLEPDLGTARFALDDQEEKPANAWADEPKLGGQKDFSDLIGPVTPVVRPKRFQLRGWLKLSEAIAGLAVVFFVGMLIHLNHNVSKLSNQPNSLSSAQSQAQQNQSLHALSTKFDNLVSKVNGIELNGGGIEQLNAYNISLGTLNDSRLSSNVSLLDANQVATGDKVFTGTVLLQNSTDSANAFRVQDSLGNNLIAVNTRDGIVSINGLQGSATKLASLTVTGDTTLDGRLTVQQATELANTLTVSGATILKSTLQAGDSTLANLTVTGNTTTNGNNSTLGNSSVSGNLAVGGNTSLAGTLDVAGATTINNTLQAGDTLLNSLNVTNDTTVGGNISVSGNSTTNGNASVGGSLTVSGPTTITNTLQAGSTTLDSLTVTNDTDIGGALGVTGATTLNNTLAVAGDLSVNGSKFTVDALTGNTDVAGTLHVAGATTLSSSLGVSGNTILSGSLQAGSSTLDSLNVTNDANVGGNFGVTGDSVLQGDLTVNGTTNFNGGTSLASLTVSGDTNLQGNVTLGTDNSNSVTINGVVHANAASILSDLTVQGDTLLEGNVTLGNTSTQTLTINGAVSTDIVPTNTQTLNLGSPSIFWKNIYVGTVHANSISAAGTSISGTTSDQFTINSDNASNDAEDEQIIFYRGTAAPNAILGWDHTNGRFTFNFPVYLGSNSLTAGALNISSLTSSGNINTTGGVLQTNSVTRVDNAGNLTNIGNLTLSGTISGGTTYTASIALQAPLLDTASAGALAIGSTNATEIDLNQNTVIASGKSLTFVGGASSFDQSASSGTFATGSGNVSLNGNTTVTGTNTFTVSGGLTTLGAGLGLTGTTNINTSGSAAINVGTGSYSGALSLGNTASTTAIAGNSSSTITFGNFSVSGAGAVNAASTITGTTLNGSVGINTGAGAGTQRIDASGNLVNIGNETLSGAISGGTSYSGSGNITSTGGLLNIQGVGTNSLTGDLAVNGGNLTTSSTGTANLFNTNATTLNIGGAATTLNLAGGSSSTGCTIDGSGNLNCSGNLIGASTGTAGYWNRAGTTLQPANAGDSITTSGNISTTGSGTITSAGLLTGSTGLSVTGNATVSGTYNTNTFTSSALTFGAASAGSIQPGIGQALNITGHASSNWTIDAGDLRIDTTAANGNLNLGNGTQAKTIQIGATSTNTGNTQTINIGSLNAAGTTNVTIGTGSSATAGTTTLRSFTNTLVYSNTLVSLGNATTPTINIQGSSGGSIGLGNNAVSTTIAIGNSSSTNTILGVSTLTGTTNINTSGSSATNIGTGSYSGLITLGNSGATINVNSPISDSSYISTNRSSTSAAVIQSQVTGDASLRFQLTAGGGLNWGDGVNPMDTNLYRASANILKTDDTFEATNLIANTGTANQVEVGLNHSGSAASAINFGSSGDISITRTATGSLAIQGTSNSTTAFQIQNSAGTSIFTADTVNQNVTVSNLLSTGTVSLQGADGGSIQLRTSANSGTGSNAMTFSGNEITDATRSADTQGDGRQAPDSSTGIWEATTNLVTNGGFESNATGWAIFQPGTTVTRVTTGAKFGSAAALVALDGTNNNQGVFYSYSYTSGQTYTLSAWVKGPAGQHVVIGYSSANQDYTLTGAWQRITYTFTASGGANRLYVTEGTHQQTMSFLLDGAQIEQTAYATPYVETNGATATRNIASVQVPSANINSTQGWAAFRIRPGNISGTQMLFSWSDGSLNNRIELYYSPNAYKIVREAAGVSTVNSGTVYTPTVGSPDTVVVSWTSTQISVSVNGGNFVSASDTNIPSGLGSTFYLGGRSFINNFTFDGDFLWSAAGTGTLTNTDAAALNNYGNSDPTLTSLGSLNSGAATPTFAWDGESTQYSGTNNSPTLQSGITIDDSTLYRYGANTLATSGNLITGGTLQAGSSTLSALTVTGNASVGGTLGVTGAATFSSTINTDTLTGSALTFGGASQATISAASGQNLAFQSGDTSHYVILQGSGGNVGIGNTTPSSGKLQVTIPNGSGDGVYAGIFENQQASGSPKGLFVSTTQNSSNLVLEVAQGSLASPTDLFTVAGNGTITLGGNTTVSSGKNFTVTSGATNITGSTNINVSGSATTTIGNASATTSLTGSVGINNSGSATTNIGASGTGNVSLGNTTGTTAIQGNSSSSINFSNFQVAANGSITSSGNTFDTNTPNGAVGINTTPSGGVALLVQNKTTSTWPTAVLRETASQTTDLLQLQNSSSQLLTGFDASGKLQFANGSGGAYDTNLYRSAAGVLQSDGQIWAGLNLAARAGASTQVLIGSVASGNAGLAFGSATDTNLYRSAAGTLKTDGSFQAAAGSSILNANGDITLRSGSTAQVFVGNIGSGVAGIQLGNTSAANLYQSAASALKTDSNLFVAGPNGVSTFSSSSNEAFRNFLSSGDSQPAVRMLGSGQLQWGPGGSTAWDTNLYRSAANTLKTDDSFVAAGINSGSGLLQGTGGLTLTGTTNINTTGSATTTIGNASSSTTIGGGLTANGSATFSDSTNSATAFQIQNSAGSSIFTADTTNQLVTVANLAATGTITLNNSQGAGIQLRTASNSSTGNAMTFSGNEITDSTRSTATQGDGRQAPDSSTGIWESTTNLITNGGFESNTTGWGSLQSATISRDTSTAKFGLASIKAVTPGSVSQEGVATGTSANPAVSPSTIYTASVWVKAPSGAHMRLDMQEHDVTNTGDLRDDAIAFVGTGNWQLVTVTATTTSSTAFVAISVATQSGFTQAITFWTDGVQVEQKAIATPYIETNGGTATRNAAKVQAPAGVLSTTQGWAAVRVRMDWPSSSAPGSFQRLFDWQTDTNNRYSLFWNQSSGKWGFDSLNGGVDTGTSLTASFNSGDYATVIAYWTASGVGISVNGSNFFVVSGGTRPSVSGATFGIGSLANSSTGQIDSDILWSAAGAGTLTNADAASLYALGNSDPTLTSINSIDSASTPTFAWDGESTQYSGTNNSFTNDSQISIDDVNLTHTANGSISIQGGANSTTAFQVQNASGSSVFDVDTTDGYVGIGTATPQAALDISGTTPVLRLSASGGNGRYFTITNNGTSTTLTQSGGAGYVQLGGNGALLVDSGAPGGSLVVNSSGQVGIKGAPANGVLTVGTNTTAATGGIYFGTDTNLYRAGANILETDGNAPQLLFHNTSSNDVPYIQGGTSGAGGNGQLILSGGTSRGVDLAYNNGTVGLHLANGGNVGIGVSSPGALLNVKDNIGNPSLSGLSFLNGNSTNNSAAILAGQDATHNLDASWTYNATAGNATAIISTYGNNNSLSIQASSVLVQSSSGSTSIGNSSGVLTLQGSNSSAITLGTNLTLDTSGNLTAAGNGSFFGGRFVLGSVGGNAGETIGLDASPISIYRSAANQLEITNVSSGVILNGSASIGSGLAPANGVLTVGTNTTASNGGIFFGTDTNLYRGGASTLQTGGLFNLSGGGSSVNVNNLSSATNAAYTSEVAGDTNARFQIQGNGQINWGPGNAVTDTTLYRSGAGQLSTGGSFVAGGGITAGSGGSHQVQIGGVGPGSAAGLVLGNSGTVNLYQQSAGVLQTDNSFVANGQLLTNSTLAVQQGTGNYVLVGNDAVAFGQNSDAKLYRTGVGSLAVQGTTNSATAFQIQNSAGTSVFTADTTNQLVTVANLAATGTITLNNSQGAGIQLRTNSNSSTGNAMTFSGNEITDQTRSVGTQGDGRQAPDSSTGIWESTTNLVTNGGFESNTTGWQTGVTGANTATLSRVTTTSKFGSAALKVVTPGSTSQEGAATNDTTFTSGQPYTFSAWVYAPYGVTMRIGLGNGTVGATNVSFTGTGAWQHVSATEMATGTGSAHGYINTNTTVQAISFYVDGAQLENKSFATPYVETNGGTATRNAAPVQAPASNLNATQGWFAANIMIPTAVANARVFSINDGTNNNLVEGGINSSANGFQVQRIASGVGTGTSQNHTFTANDQSVVVFAWTATTIKVSVNGAAFTSVSDTNIPSGLTNFDIGSRRATLLWLDGNVLWSAAGTGTLSDADAASLYALGNSDPTLTSINSIDGSAAPTFAWDGESTQYSGTNNSFTNNSQISIDDVNLTHTSNGSISIQGGANSTTAFNVQDAAGTSVFDVDTTHDRVGVGTTSPTQALTVNGSITTTSYNQFIGYVGNTDIQYGGSLLIRTAGVGQVTVASGGATTFKNSVDSTAAFQIQNHAGTSNLLVADTTDTQIGIGTTPANALLTVGTNTTAASGGIYFGTDTNLYRSGSAALTSNSSLTLQGNSLSLGNGSAATISTPSGNANLTLQANGTGTLALNTTGAGTVNVATANTTALSLGNTSSSFTAESNSTANLFNGATAHTIQVGTGAAVQTVTLGSTNSTSKTTIQGGATTGGITLVANGSSNTGIVAQVSNNSTSAFQIQNASSISIFTADTAGSSNTGSAPASPAVVAGSSSGGTMSGSAGTTYYYEVTAIVNGIETPASSEVSINGASFTPLSAPGSALTAVVSTTGNVSCNNTAGQGCKYEVTYVTANGETTGGTASTSLLNVASKIINLANIPTGPTGTTARNIYRSTNGGAYLFDQTINDNTTTTGTDNVASPSGAIPVTNTAITNNNKAVVSWSAVTNASSYRIYRGTSSGGENTLFVSSITSYHDGGDTGTTQTVSNAVSTTSTLQAASNAFIFKAARDYASAFQIQNASGTNLFVVDTITGTISLGSPSSNPVLLVLGNKNTSGDPAGNTNGGCVSGATYYNSYSNLYRICQNGSWTSMPGQQIDYAQITSPLTGINGTCGGGPCQVLTGNAVTYDGSTQVKIEFYCPSVASTGGTGLLELNLYEDGTDIGLLDYWRTFTTNQQYACGTATYTITPTAGSHTFSIYAGGSSGSFSLLAGPGGTGQYLPAYMRITSQ